MDGSQKKEIVRFLEHYPIAQRNVTAMEKKIRDLDELCFPDGVDTTKEKVTSSNTSDTIFETVVRREKQRLKYEKIKKREEDYLELHDMAFEKLSDAEQEVLRRLYQGRRYADGKIWLAAHGYAYSTIYKGKNRGLKKMHRYVFGSEDYIILKKRRQNVDKNGGER